MGERKIDYEAWSRSMLGFIRAKGLEVELQDWCGGFPCPITPAESRAPSPDPEAGPWRVGGDGSQVEDAAGRLVADCGNPEDAARIAALSGIDPEAVAKAREALNKSLEFVVFFLAFTGRDYGSDRWDKTLGQLLESARKEDARIREALAALGREE